jgi:4,5-dihydroxyphthalate decarboxylase
MNADTRTLRAALGDYPHTAPIKTGDIRPAGFAFEFAEFKPISRAFAPMVRELKFDVSEIAIVTYLQAKAYGKPLVLLPAVMMGRFQHGCMVYNAERGALTPSDLPGKRIAVRAYSQTTGAWLRGILQNDYGVDIDRAQWITFEDPHVAECKDPGGIERAAPGKDMTEMLLAGEVDAAIYGAAMPTDPRLKSLIADPVGDAKAWHRRHGVVPVNHLVCVSEALASSSPAVVREVFACLLKGKAAAGLPRAGEIDTIPFGLAALRPALELAIDYAVQQKLVPRRLSVDALFDDTTRALTA